MNVAFTNINRQIDEIYQDCKNLGNQAAKHKTKNLDNIDLLENRIRSLSNQIQIVKNNTPSISNERKYCEIVDRKLHDLARFVSYARTKILLDPRDRARIHGSLDVARPDEGIKFGKQKYHFIHRLIDTCFNRISREITRSVFYRYGSKIRQTSRGEEKLYLEAQLELYKCQFKYKLSLINELTLMLNDSELSKSAKKELSHEINRLEKSVKSMTSKLHACQKKLSELQLYLNKIHKKKSEGDQARARMLAVGGERLTLTTKEGYKLDGLYMDGKAFKQKLHEAGAHHVVFQGEENGVKYSLNALSFENEEAGKDFDLYVAGWSQVTLIGDERVFWVRDSEIKSNPTVMDDNGLCFHESVEMTTDVEIDPEQGNTGGTVILTFGSAGQYEQYEGEILAHLLMGMNVVTANPPGFGLSGGVPGKTSFENYVEAMYQFTKSHTEQADEKILFNALCLSAGAAAKVAAKHPKTNLMLNQTYADLKEIVKDSMKEQIEGALSETLEAIENVELPLPIKKVFFAVTEKLFQLMTKLAVHTAATFAPNLSVEKHIGRNKGHQAIVYVKDDEMIPEEHVIRNIKAGLKSKEAKLTVIYSQVGEHGSGWLDMTTTPQAHNYTQKIEEWDAIIEESEEEIDRLEGEIYFARQRLRSLSVDSDEYAVAASDVSNLQESINEKKFERKSLEKLIADKIRQKESIEDNMQLAFNNSEINKEGNLVANQYEHFLAKAGLQADIIPRSEHILTQAEIEKIDRVYTDEQVEKYKRKIGRYKDILFDLKNQTEIDTEAIRKNEKALAKYEKLLKKALAPKVPKDQIRLRHATVE